MKNNLDSRFPQMNDYLERNLPPLLVELLFIIACRLLPAQHILYANTLFYLFLFLYYLRRKDFSFHGWLDSLKSGKLFWRQTCLTAVAFFAAFGVTLGLEAAFPQWNSGMIAFKVNSWPGFFCFLLSTVLLPAITEESFFRKSMISFASKPLAAFTALLGMFFYALEHALRPWGIVLCMIWALPLTFSYIKTKNIYIPITAHFIANLLGNSPDVIALLMKLLPN